MLGVPGGTGITFNTPIIISANSTRISGKQESQPVPPGPQRTENGNIVLEGFC